MMRNITSFYGLAQSENQITWAVIREFMAALSEHHSEMIGSYLKFAKFQRGKHVRTIEQTFDDLKLSRLGDVDVVLGASEVVDLLDELWSLVKGGLEVELMSTAQSAALLLCQVCQQAQAWHLTLTHDIGQLEDRELLEGVGRLEGGSPLRKLQPLGAAAATPLLQAEIDRLNAENKKLYEKLQESEKQMIDALEKGSQLTLNLAETQRELKELREAEDVEKDDEMSQVKKKLEATMTANACTQQHLESDLVETKQRLLEVQAQLHLAEKELEIKLHQTGAFKNMKQILASKNEQIKSLRQRLNKYEDED